MTETERTTAAPICASPNAAEPELFENREVWALRRRLGIRPIAHNQGDHPDSGPCPAWCWIATAGHDGWGHEINQRHPMAATHTSDDNVPEVALSLYEADPGRGEDPWVRLSTLEPRLEQVGQGDPEVVIGRRTYKGRECTWEDEFLRLTLDDTQDLIAVLAHLVKLADQ